MSFYKEVPGLQTTLESALKFDTKPTAGSTNPVTSEGIANAIAGASGALDERLTAVEDCIPDTAGAGNKLVTQSAFDAAEAGWQAGYTPKGDASVSTLNGLTGQSNGDTYILTDSGTLSAGSLAVSAGDSVAWDDANSKWYKVSQYALEQFGTNEIHKLSTTATEADLVGGNYLALDGAGGTKKLPADAVAKRSVQDDNTNNLYALTNVIVKRNCIVNPLGNEDNTLVEPYGCTGFISVDFIKDLTVIDICSMPNSNVNAIVFFDENKDFVGVYSNGTNYHLNVKIDDTLLANYAGAKYARFNVYKTTSKIYFDGNVFKLMDSNAESNTAHEASLNYLELFVNTGILHKNGSTSPYAGFKYTNLLSVDLFKGLSFSSLYGHNGNNIVPLQFFNAVKAFTHVVEAEVNNQRMFLSIEKYATSNDVYFRVMSRDTWTPKVTNTLSRLVDDVRISAPKNIYCAVGEKLQVFRDSLYYSLCKTNGVLSSNISNPASSNVYPEVFEYSPTGAETRTATFAIVTGNNTTMCSSEHLTNIVSFAKKSSPSSNKNLLILGDSFTANNYYPQELKRRLVGSGTAAYVDPNGPASDNLTNLSVYMEGHVGWDYDDYLGSSSPFYNPGTQQIDIDYYCTQKGITGGLDYVAIVLGTNHQCTDSVISQFWDKLKAHNANIKVVVSGRILFSPYKVEINSTIFDYNRRVEALAGSSSYSANFCFVDILPTFDMYNNMSYTEVDANNRNPNVKRKVSIEYTHPSKYGYWQIADTIYSGIHYWCLE